MYVSVNQDGDGDHDDIAVGHARWVAIEAGLGGLALGLACRTDDVGNNEIVLDAGTRLECARKAAADQ